MSASANSYYFAKTAAERERQDKKFGEQNTGRSLTRYLSIITEEFGEGVREINGLLEEMEQWAIQEDGALTEEQYTRVKLYFDRAETEMVETMACILLLLTNMRAGTYRLA